MNKRLIYIILLLFSFRIHAATVQKQIHINKGYFAALDTTYFYYLSYNSDSTFSQQSVLITLMQNDSLVLQIYNHDSVDHHFFIAGKASQKIASNGSATVRLLFTQFGINLFYDDLQFPKNMYLGLSGTIAVLEQGRDTKNFYWNLRDHQKQWNIQEGNTINLSQYDPDYFTINGQSFPVVQNDSLVKIMGKVGDTILLYMVNSGLSAHSIHFHGYHSRIVSTTSKTLKKNWEKDTYPLETMENIILELIPDKPGIFPVHDHNLVAISGGGRYPNGMLIMMEIK